MMLRNFACAAVFAAAVWAQAPVLNGPFVLAQEGPSSATLAVLKLDASGAVSGTEYVQSPGVTQAVPVTGAVQIAADGSGTLTLYSTITTEDGEATAVAAIYDFLSAKATGFVAIRRDSAAATVAEITPVASAPALAGSFLLADEGVSPSGERVAEIGLLTFKADGTLAGRVVVKQNSASEARAVDGSFVADGSGFGTLKFHSNLPADEDGGVGVRTTPYVFAVTAAGEIVALRSDNSVLGLARLAPVR